MSQSPATVLHPNSPQPMKKNAIIALAVVFAGHAVVLWAVGQMKPAKLPVIEHEPINVRFVEIQAPPPPLPPEPKVESKPEVKEVKVVEQPPPPPKKVERVQQVEKAPTREVTKAQPVEVPVSIPTTTVSETVTPAPVQAPPQPAPQPAAQPSQDNSPRTVAIGGSGVQWSRSPRPSYTNRDLQGQTRTVVVMIEADASGRITNVRVTRSSGVPALDEKILRSVRSARFKPYRENGVAYPIRAEQPFELTLNPNG